MATDSLLGPMPDCWHASTLGEVAARSGGDIQTGPFGSQLHASDYVDDGIPSIMPKNIGDNRVDVEGIARITETDAKRLARYRVRHGDIVYSRRGDVEKRALIRDDEVGWLCGTGCLRVRFDDDSISPEYVAFYLGHPAVREWIVRHAHGATMPNLNTSILSALPLIVPPIAEQRAIAHILGTLDDKIELNRQMNATLDEIARTLFTSWFVSFDPVRAKSEGRQPEGMDAETAAHFPDRLVDSDLGPIPEGWRVLPLDEIATFLNGLALQKFPPSPNGPNLPVIKIAQLKKGNTEGADLANTDVPTQFVVEDGDLLFSWSGSLESKIWGGGTGALNQHLFKVTSETYSKWFYHYWIRHHLPTFQAIAAGKATTMGHIQRRHITEALVICPSVEVLERLGGYFAPLIDMMSNNQIESRTLAELRDTLLPKLLSGRIQAPVAEHLAGAVT